MISAVNLIRTNSNQKLSLTNNSSNYLSKDLFNNNAQDSFSKSNVSFGKMSKAEKVAAVGVLGFAAGVACNMTGILGAFLVPMAPKFCKLLEALGSELPKFCP